MTREEEISLLVRIVRRIRSDRHIRIAQFLEHASEDQEQRAAMRSRIEELYEFEHEPVWRRLLKRIASEDRNGIIYLNPVTHEHAMTAEKLIEGTP